MYRTSLNFHDRIERGEQPIVYALINTAIGWRAYGEKGITGTFDVDTVYLADGSYTAGGSILAGGGSGYGIVDSGARLTSIQAFERTVRPTGKDLLKGYVSKQLAHVSVEFDNADRHFSKLIPREPFLCATLALYTGFEDIAFSEHRRMFKGTISQVELQDGTMTVEADEQ